MDEKFNFLIALSVFAATGLTEVLWVFYIRRTSAGKALGAAMYNMIIIFIGGFIITSYIENILYVVPAGLGAFISTFFTIKYDVRKTDKLIKV